MRVRRGGESFASLEQAQYILFITLLRIIIHGEISRGSSYKTKKIIIAHTCIHSAKGACFRKWEEKKPTPTHTETNTHIH